MLRRWALFLSETLKYAYSNVFAIHVCGDVLFSLKNKLRLSKTDLRTDRGVLRVCYVWGRSYKVSGSSSSSQEGLPTSSREGALCTWSALLWVLRCDYRQTSVWPRPWVFCQASNWSICIHSSFAPLGQGVLNCKTEVSSALPIRVCRWSW